VSKLSDTLKKIVGHVAPFAPVVATALGGPGAGAAVRFLSGKLLGKGDGTEAEIAAALAGATPEQLLALKSADYDFELEQQRTDQKDRDGARQMRIATGDWVPGALAVFITVGFFGVLGYILSEGVPAQGGEALLVMLGALGAAWGQVIAFYFGSSAGSKAKTDALSRAIK
jgi:hypothetical protein